MPIEDKAAYLREWRRTDVGKAYMAQQKKRDKARKRALVELSKRHQAEYDRLLLKHLSELSVDG